MSNSVRLDDLQKVMDEIKNQEKVLNQMLEKNNNFSVKNKGNHGSRERSKEAANRSIISIGNICDELLKEKQELSMMQEKIRKQLRLSSHSKSPKSVGRGSKVRLRKQKDNQF